MAFNLTVTRDSIFINGETISPPPGKRSGRTTTAVVNNRIYVNGFKYIDGKWKRTLKALWHHLF